MKIAMKNILKLKYNELKYQKKKKILELKYNELKI